MAEQEPKKIVKESKHGDRHNEDDELIFVGVDHVNRDDDVYFVRQTADDVSRADVSKQLSSTDTYSGNPHSMTLRDKIPLSISLTVNTSIPSEGAHPSSSRGQNAASFPPPYLNDKAHLHLQNPVIENNVERLAETDLPIIANQHKTSDFQYEYLRVLLCDFYYGQLEGHRRPEQKTHTTFKCLSCLKVLKNIKFMNHMKHHLEYERQRGDSWESHTNCQHCYRRFPIPFELQCHVNSVHSSQEPSFVCKICELSFVTDQALLQHMKNTHKPKEMPYECQVCGYMSSVFIDVETHFRACHENTKSLLCPFCLKVFKVATPYTNHIWKHWTKTAFWCSKCRLQFLTLREKFHHETKNHSIILNPEK
ncbi:PREDICTED: zinc finger protein 280A-like [Elephantulus edwardii]|uniref:zinc finger protein 280A-like n=1 Tax=Elephantulus edwardii TaxID=28737 RepID=UPI0003F073D8|nr:PREDICTED: zinc finger protein 280A-like [Elephantulus edwardii]